jgi:hypothetical protein
MPREVEANWVVPECCLQVLGGGHRIPIIELNLFALYLSLDLLKLFRETYRWQHIVILVVGGLEHQRRREEEGKMDLVTQAMELVRLCP